MSDFRPAPVKPLVSGAALDTLDIRLGTIQDLADVPDSKKLVAPEAALPDGARAG